MRSSPKKSPTQRPPCLEIVSLSFEANVMLTRFRDGRLVETSLEQYPRLMHGSHSERNRWRLIGPGTGIHWPDLDEDISAQNILEGKPSLEGEGSFRGWLAQRAAQVQLA